jgi:hypothetical protein
MEQKKRKRKQTPKKQKRIVPDRDIVAKGTAKLEKEHKEDSWDGEHGRFVSYQKDIIELINKDIGGEFWSTLESFGDFWVGLVSKSQMSYISEKARMFLENLELHEKFLLDPKSAGVRAILLLWKMLFEKGYDYLTILTDQDELANCMQTGGTICHKLMENEFEVAREYFQDLCRHMHISLQHGF